MRRLDVAMGDAAAMQIGKQCRQFADQCLYGVGGAVAHGDLRLIQRRLDEIAGEPVFAGPPQAGEGRMLEGLRQLLLAGKALSG